MVGKLAQGVYMQQKMEILTALRKLGEKVKNAHDRHGVFSMGSWMIHGLVVFSRQKLSNLH